jgi:hypothetical protein
VRSICDYESVSRLNRNVITLALSLLNAVNIEKKKQLYDQFRSRKRFPKIRSILVCVGWPIVCITYWIAGRNSTVYFIFNLLHFWLIVLHEEQTDSRHIAFCSRASKLRALALTKICIVYKISLCGSNIGHTRVKNIYKLPQYKVEGAS